MYTKKKVIGVNISTELPKPALNPPLRTIEPLIRLRAHEKKSSFLFNLSHSMGKYSRGQVEAIFFLFSQKTGSGISLERICMKCQILFSRENIEIKTTFQDVSC